MPFGEFKYKTNVKRVISYRFETKDMIRMVEAELITLLV